MYYKLERKNSHREIVAGSNNLMKWLGGAVLVGASVAAPAMFAEGASAAEIPAEDLTTSISQEDLGATEQAYQAEINAQLQQQAAAEQAAAEQAAAEQAAQQQAAAEQAAQQQAAAEQAAQQQAAAEQAAQQQAAAEQAAQQQAAAEQEAARVAAEQEAARVAAEQEAARVAAEQEAARVAAEQEAARVAAEQEAARVAAEQEAARVAAEQEAARVAAEQEAARVAAEQEVNPVVENDVTQTVTTVSEQTEQSTPTYDVNTSEDNYFSFVKNGKVYVVGNVDESQYAEIAQQLRDKYGITDSEVYVYNSADYKIGDNMTLEDDDNNHIIDIIKGENGSYTVTGDGIDQISDATLKEQTENTTEQKQQPVNENTQQNQNQGSSSTDVYETQDYKYNYNVTVGDSDYLLFKGADGKYDIVFGGVGMSAGQISELQKQLIAEGKIPADASIVSHVIPNIGAGQKVDLSNSGYGEVMFGVNADGTYTLSSNETGEFANGLVKFEKNKQLQDNADEYKNPDAEPLSKPVPETPTPDTPEPTPDTPEPTPEKPENPEQPKTPDTPEKPENPEQPKAPEQPVVPQTPVTPQAPVPSSPLASTGSETDMLGAMGLGAAGLGLALLAGAKRRKKYALDRNGSNAVRFAQIPDEDLAILGKINNIDESNILRSIKR